MKLIIPIEPKAQMRTEPSVIRLADGTYRGGTHKKAKQRSREETLKAFLALHQPETPFEGPLLFGLKAYLPMPKMSREKTAQALAGVLRPTTKPDLDNLIKQIKDCLSQMRYWGDDKQVVGYLPHTGKYYSDQPRWEIEIVEFQPPKIETISHIRGQLVCTLPGLV